MVSFAQPQTVTHPSINWVRCRATTTLTETSTRGTRVLTAILGGRLSLIPYKFIFQLL